MGGLIKKIKKLGKNIEKEAKKLGKSTEKVLKESLVPIAITYVTGGTGGAILKIIAGTAISRQVTKSIKDDTLKVAVKCAITGSVAGSQSLGKDIAKTIVTNEVAKKTNSSAIGVLTSSALCGDFKNANDLGKCAVKEVAREKVTKAVQKKTKNQYLSQGAGFLVGAGIDNLCDNLENKENKVKIQETISKNNFKEKEIIEDLNFGDTLIQSTNNWDTNDLNFGNKSLKSDNWKTNDLNFGDMPSKSDDNWNTNDLNFGDKPSKSDDSWFTKNLNFGETTVQPASSWDTKDPSLRIKTTFKNGDRSTSVFNDFKNLKVSSTKKINNNLSVGETVSINNKDVRFGLSSKTNGNKYTESGIGYETGKSLSEREVFGYNINRTDIKTDSKGGCVSKQTYKHDIKIPFCGKIGSISQDILTCNDSITITDKVGLNSNAAVCGVSTVVPVGKAVTVSGRTVIGVGKAIKETGMVLGTVTMTNGALVAAN